MANRNRRGNKIRRCRGFELYECILVIACYSLYPVRVKQWIRVHYSSPTNILLTQTHFINQLIDII